MVKFVDGVEWDMLLVFVGSDRGGTEGGAYYAEFLRYVFGDE